MISYRALFVCLIASIFISCVDSENEYDDLTYSEMQKLSYVEQLMQKYGWEKDSTVSESQRRQMILNEDIKAIEALFEMFDNLEMDLVNGGDLSSEIVSTSHGRNMESTKVVEGVWQTHVYGNHTSQFITSTSAMTVHYKYSEMFQIISSSINSTPKCKWTPNKSCYKLNKYQ